MNFRRLFRHRAWVCASFLLVLALAHPGPAAGAAPVGLLTLDGAIGPATADHVVRSLAHAHERGLPCRIISVCIISCRV